MKLLLFLFAVLFAATGIAYLALNKPGYVLLGYGHTSIELPLFDFLVLVFVAATLIYLAGRFLLGLLNTPAGIQRFSQRKRIRRARRDLSRALLEMAEGNWKKAEKLATASAERSETPVINYLVAAHAAQRQRAPSRRDEYLRKASQLDPQAELAVGLAQAELQMHQKQHEEALATLKRLETIRPDHPFVHKLLARLHHRMGDFESLHALLPRLRKGAKLPPDELERLESDTIDALMSRAGDDGDLGRLESLWKSLPGDARQNPKLVFVYARSLIQLKEFERARLAIEKTLDQQWDNRLAALYGDIEFDDPAAALKKAEQWLANHPDSAELLVTAARLCIGNGLWGKARSLLEQSLAIEPSPRGYQALAELHERLDEPDQAKRAYKEGFRLLVRRDDRR